MQPGTNLLLLQQWELEVSLVWRTLVFCTSPPSNPSVLPTEGAAINASKMFPVGSYREMNTHDFIPNASIGTP